jgi:tetratricopeptide (TPR) repeat protein
MYRAEPLSADAGRAPGGLLGASLIVRNEAAFLAACLESIRPVVDDIVVVDTGSDDDSPAIAASCGARVFRYPWHDDFGAARNSALELCRTDWILYIDADERLAPCSREEIAQLLAGAREVAFRLLLRPVIGATPYREYRLWRNDARIRFRGAIHENVVPSIHAVGAMDRRPIGTCDLLLEHVGYEGDQTRKHLRNLPLLQRQVRITPENLFLWHHLSRVLAGLQRWQASKDVLRHAISLSRKSGHKDYCGVLLFTELIGMRMADGEEVAALLAEGRAAYPDNCVLLWQEGRHLVASGEPGQALARFDELLEVDPDVLPDIGPAYDQRLFGESAHEGRGLALLRLGRFAEAAAAYAEAERCAPGTTEYAVKRQLAASLSRRDEPASARKEDRGPGLLAASPPRISR